MGELTFGWEESTGGGFFQVGGMSRFLASEGGHPHLPHWGKPWQICKYIMVYLVGHTWHNMNQLQHPLHHFIPKFYRYEGFLLQMHGKNNFESFKCFLKRWLDFRTQLKIEWVFTSAIAFCRCDVFRYFWPDF